MKTKKMLALVAFSSGLVMSASASAGMVVIDNFDMDQGPIGQTVKGKGVLNQTITDTNSVRTLTHTLLASRADTQSTVSVANSELDITNGTGEDSRVTVSWLLGAHLIPTNATNIAFNFFVNESDANNTELKFSFDGKKLEDAKIPGNTMNKSVSFKIEDGDINKINKGGNLLLTINGEKGWDMNIDAFGISYDDPINVPEPGVLGLMGLGLAGLGALRRKKQA